MKHNAQRRLTSFRYNSFGVNTRVRDQTTGRNDGFRELRITRSSSAHGDVIGVLRDRTCDDVGLHCTKWARSAIPTPGVSCRFRPPGTRPPLPEGRTDRWAVVGDYRIRVKRR